MCVGRRIRWGRERKLYSSGVQFFSKQLYWVNEDSGPCLPPCSLLDRVQSVFAATAHRPILDAVLYCLISSVSVQPSSFVDAGSPCKVAIQLFQLADAKGSCSWSLLGEFWQQRENEVLNSNTLLAAAFVGGAFVATQINESPIEQCMKALQNKTCRPRPERGSDEVNFDEFS